MQIFIDEENGAVASQQVRVRFQTDDAAEADKLRILFLAAPSEVHSEFHQTRYPNMTHTETWLVFAKASH